MANSTVDFSSEMSETEFYHQLANVVLVMAEGTFGVAIVGNTKKILWPPIQFFFTSPLELASSSQR